MKWVTRKQIRVNRVASAWLIRRFIDPQAEFIFVDPAEVANVQKTHNAKGFDATGASYPHKDSQGRCSFEALVDEYCPNDPVLRQIASMVRRADFPDEVALTKESAGIRAISHGFPLVRQNDEETVLKASFLYDALYATLEPKRDEP